MKKKKQKKNIIIQVESERQSPGNVKGENISQEMVLKQVHSKSNNDPIVKVKYFLPRVVKFPGSEAIVEFWGLSLEFWNAIVKNKVTYTRFI